MPLYIWPGTPQVDLPIEKRNRFWDKFYGRGKSYSYHDTPDGQDMFKKLEAITRNIAIIATPLGFIYGKDGLSNRSNIVALAETFKIAYPPVLAGATFALVSNTLAKSQGKSGHHNYFFSGFSAGCVWSLGFRHDFYTGLGRAILFGALAAFYYEVRVVEGYKFIPDKMHWNVKDYGYPRSKEFFNWSLVEDIPISEVGTDLK